MGLRTTIKYDNQGTACWDGIQWDPPKLSNIKDEWKYKLMLNSANNQFKKIIQFSFKKWQENNFFDPCP